MSVDAETAFAANTATRQQLFALMLRTVLIATGILLVGMVVGLVVPAMRTPAIGILAIVVAVEFSVAAISTRLVTSGQLELGGGLYVILTLLLGAVAGAVMRSVPFVALITALTLVMSALIISATIATVITALGALLVLTMSQFDTIDVLESFRLVPGVATTVVQAAFTLAALGVLLAVSVLTAQRLNHSLADARQRAAEAETARRDEQIQARLVAAEAERQRLLLDQVAALEVPIMPVFDQVLLVPLVGPLDAERLARISTRTLQRAATDRVTWFIIDLTAAIITQREDAKPLADLAQALRLLGVQVIITGISAAGAITFINLDVDLRGLTTYATTADALRGLKLS